MARTRQRPGKWHDHYTREAQKANYPARSVFKLKEIQQKFKLIRKGDRVLDLGCAPGSWTLYAAELAGPDGQVVGVDLNAVSVKLPPRASVVQGDVLGDDKMLLESIGKGYNVVLSDMAPSTTGSKSVDAARSFNLCRAALRLAETCLAPGGGFACKIFQGDEFKNFCDAVASVFRDTKIFKPQSSRKASSEIYIVGKGKK